MFLFSFFIFSIFFSLVDFMLPSWTERSVEPTLAIHVLPVLGLLLLAYAANIVALDLFVFCRAKASKAKHGSHGGLLVIGYGFVLIGRSVFVHGFWF
jgi:hypothetical protein